MFRSDLFGAFVLTVCIRLSNLHAADQFALRSGSQRDLQSVIDAKVLRVAVTRFDLPAFHVRGADGAPTGSEIEMVQQIGRALGVGVQLIDSAESFDAVVDFVAAGRADIGVSKLS